MSPSPILTLCNRSSFLISWCLFYLLNMFHNIFMLPIKKVAIVSLSSSKREKTQALGAFTGVFLAL